MKKILKNKKAIFFSTDALIALTIILLAALVIFPIIKYKPHESDVPGDVIKVLSSLKIGEINNSYVKLDLIPNGKIQDYNKSVLEQIGDFYVTDRAIAKQLADSVISTIDANENIGLWYGDELIASRNITAIEGAKNIEVDRQIISGISGDEPGESVTGFSARAYLTSSLPKKYFYFGGYVGDGNISVNINYIGIISNMSFEITTNRDFELYINGNYAGYYDKSPSQLQPASYDPSYENFFNSGENTVEFVGVGGNLYITGGFIKITYNNSEPYEDLNKYNLPGIDGVINLYDGFYVPGDLNNLEFHLKAKVNDPEKNIYVRMGDRELFNASTGGNLIDIDITDAEIRNILAAAGETYSDYSRKTIPIRVAVEGIDYIQTEVIAEIFSDVMLSGSINSNNVKARVDGIDYIKDDAVKEANKKMVDILLSINNTFLGLVPSQDGVVYMAGYHPLSQDNVSLKSKINNWVRGTGNKDICASINKSIYEFTSTSDFKAIILTFFDSPNQCNVWGLSAPGLDEKIKNKVCSLSATYNVTFYTVEMNLGNSQPAQETRKAIKEMANCSGGKYVNADYLENGLMDAYNDIIIDIISLIYEMQTVDVITSSDVSSYLSPESYIKFDYTRTNIPYGLITTYEKQFDNSLTGSFSVPSGLNIGETKVVSYSGPRWTKYVFINNEIVYNLSDYGQEYTKLGDPYVISIPNSLVQENNIVNLRTGLSPETTFDGSEYNKIIYTLVRNMPSYSQIVSYVEGCNWTIKFETGAPVTLRIPEGYQGTDTCYYGPDDSGPYCEQEAQKINCENSNDALQIAVYNLLKILDNDENNKVDTRFTEQDMKIDFTQITGIPYPWSTEVQVRKWT